MRAILITISCAELLDVIGKWSYTLGERFGDEDPKSRYFVQGATDRGHADLLMERMRQAWSDIENTLSAYMVKRNAVGCAYEYCTISGCKKIAESEVDIYYTEHDNDFVLRLYMPDTTYPLVGKTIADCCKRYLLSNARNEWCALTGQDLTMSMSEAERAMQRLRVAMTGRVNVGKVRNWNYGYS